MKRQFELPVRKVMKASKSLWVYSKDDFLICKCFGHQRAEYIVQAINSHEKLVDTLKKFRDECDDNNHNKHHKEFHHMCKICVIDEALEAVEKPK